jgi:hypothetical protein
MMLFNMLPRFVAQNASYIRTVAIEQVCNFLMARAYPCKAANLAHFMDGKFRKLFSPSKAFRMSSGTMPFATGDTFRTGSRTVSLSTGSSPFLSTVFEIFRLRTKSEVIWIDTRRTVAPVKHVQALSGSGSQFKGDAMSLVHTSAKPETSVSVGVFASPKQPTTIFRFFYECPKAILVVLGKLGQCSGSQIRSHTTGVVRALGLVKSIRALALFTDGRRRCK